MAVMLLPVTTVENACNAATAAAAADGGGRDGGRGGGEAFSAALWFTTVRDKTELRNKRCAPIGWRQSAKPITLHCDAASLNF